MTTQGISTMTLDRLRQLAAAYGADPRHWPASERDAATALIAGSSVARGVLAEAGQLDALLGMAPAEVPDEAMARLTAATAFPPRRPIASSPTASANGWMGWLASAFWPRATVLGGMMALGIITGLAVEPVYSSTDAFAAVMSDLTGDLDEEWEL